MYSPAMGVHLAVDIHSQVLKASASQFFSFFNLENIHLLSASLIVVGYGHLNWVLFVTLEQVTSHSNWSGSWLEEVTHSLGGSASFFSVLLPAYLFQTWETDHWRFHLLSHFCFLPTLAWCCFLFFASSMRGSHHHLILLKSWNIKFNWKHYEFSSGTSFKSVFFWSFLHDDFFSSFLLRDCGVEEMVP